jgi:hypothetical protein
MAYSTPTELAMRAVQVPEASSFSHLTIPSVPHSPGHNPRSVASVRSGVMGTAAMGTTDHRKCAEECLAMARLADADSDKALWLTLAQSWVRLGEHVAHMESRATALEASDENEPEEIVA